MVFCCFKKCTSEGSLPLPGFSSLLVIPLPEDEVTWKRETEERPRKNVQRRETSSFTGTGFLLHDLPTPSSSSWGLKEGRVLLCPGFLTYKGLITSPPRMVQGPPLIKHSSGPWEGDDSLLVKDYRSVKGISSPKDRQFPGTLKEWFLTTSLLFGGYFKRSHYPVHFL